MHPLGSSSQTQPCPPPCILFCPVCSYARTAAYCCVSTAVCCVSSTGHSTPTSGATATRSTKRGFRRRPQSWWKSYSWARSRWAASLSWVIRTVHVPGVPQPGVTPCQGLLSAARRRERRKSERRRRHRSKTTHQKPSKHSFRGRRRDSE